MLDYKKIGKFIIQEREKLDLTQEQLADKIYVTRPAVSKWERGLSLPNYELLMYLCDLFNVTPNEMLAGERKNPTNKDYINNITIDVLKENTKKIKKIIFGIIISSILIIFSFLLYFFVSTYNKFEVYKIKGESEIFKMDEILAFFSNEKAIINFSSIYSYDYYYDYISVYFMKGDNKVHIFSSNRSATLIDENNGYNNYFNFKDINIMLDNLYMDIYYNNGEKDLVDTIKLNAVKLYSNDKLILKKSLPIATE